MKAIVAADKNWGIGKDNNLLVSIPSDMKNFRALTLGNVVVMGRKTFESLPNQAPLEERDNIVITKDKNFKAKGVTLVHSLDELDKELEGFDDDRVFVIGGGSIYKQLIDRCDEVYVTKINYSYKADTYFPDLDNNADWKLVYESEEHTYFDIEYTFTRYKRV